MKTTRILGASGAAILSTAFLLAFAPAAQAATFPDLVYSLTLNLGSLDLNPSAPLSLDFQLITGSGNVTNTVKLTNFVFTGGTAGAVDIANGGESGSLASGILLTSTPNGSLDNEIALALSSGVTQITFTVDQTPNSELVGTGTAIPDQFNVAILDGDFDNIPTTDPSGGNALVSSVLGSTSTLATVKQYSVVAAPEPSSTGLFLLGAGGLVAMLGLRRRNA